MWDRLTVSFDNFFTGGKWGAYIGMAVGAVIGLMSPGAVPGNEIYAAVTGGLMYGVIGASAGAALGVGSGLVFGGGDTPDAPANAPEVAPKLPEKQVAQSEAVEPPSSGLMASLFGSGKGRNGGGRSA